MKITRSTTEQVLQAVDMKGFQKVVTVLLDAARRRSFAATCPMCGAESPKIFKIQNFARGPRARCLACCDEDTAVDVVDLVMHARGTSEDAAARWVASLLDIDDAAAPDDENSCYPDAGWISRLPVVPPKGR